MHISQSDQQAVFQHQIDLIVSRQVTRSLRDVSLLARTPESHLNQRLDLSPFPPPQTRPPPPFHRKTSKSPILGPSYLPLLPFGTFWFQRPVGRLVQHCLASLTQFHSVPAILHNLSEDGVCAEAPPPGLLFQSSGSLPAAD